MKIIAQQFISDLQTYYNKHVLSIFVLACIVCFGSLAALLHFGDVLAYFYKVGHGLLPSTVLNYLGNAFRWVAISTFSISCALLYLTTSDSSTSTNENIESPPTYGEIDEFDSHFDPHLSDDWFYDPSYSDFVGNIYHHDD